MGMRIAGIEWDEGNSAKCQKHGVSKEEIESVLLNPRTVGFPDALHSSMENCFWTIGRNEEGRCIFLIFTYRSALEGRCVRPISARYMHQKEVDYYEKEIPGF